MMNTKTSSPTKKFCERAPHTYNEWGKHGFYVMWGEKATGRDKKGTLTFTRKQVKPKPKLTKYNLDIWDIFQ